MDFAATIADSKGKTPKIVMLKDDVIQNIGASITKYSYAIGEKEVDFVEMTQEQWDAVKDSDSSPLFFGSLPCFIHDGAIVEGNVAWKAAGAVALPEVMQDPVMKSHKMEAAAWSVFEGLQGLAAGMKGVPDDEKQEKGMALFAEHIIPNVKGLQKMLGDKSYLSGDTMHPVDIVMFVVLDALITGMTKKAAPMVPMVFGSLVAYVDRFKTHEKIAPIYTAPELPE